MKLTLRSILGFVAIASLFAVSAARATEPAAAPAFNPEADCKAQPSGLTLGFKLAPGQVEVLPELKADTQPEFAPAETIKDIFLQLAKPVLGDRAEQMVDAMAGVCLSKKNGTLYASLYFKKVFTLELKPYTEAVSMETYQAVFPTLVRIQVEQYGKFVEAYFSGRYLDALRLKTKIPALSDWVYLHHLTINTDTQELRIGAGAMHDRVKIVAWSTFAPGKPIISKVAVGSTLGRIFHRPGGGWQN